MKPLSFLKFVLPISLSLAVVTLSPVFAQSGGSQAIVQYTPHDRLYSVAFNGDFGLAVGESGLVLQTTDGGKTWAHEVSSPTKLAMFSVAINGSRSIAVGQQGLILVRDGRNAWRKVESITDQRLLRVSLNKSGVAVAVGAFGTLLKSTDNGQTWAQLKPDWAKLYKTADTSDFLAARDEPTLYIAKVLDDGSMFIGGEYGQLNRSTDGGVTWTPVYQASAIQGATPPSLFGMDLKADGTGYAAGHDGLIVSTADSGKTWTKVDSNSHASYFDIASTSDGHVFAVGMRSGIVSADGGKSWQQLKDLDINLNWYSGLAHSENSSGNSIFAVGHSGRVLQLIANGN